MPTTWTITGLCPSTSDKVIVTNNTPSTANANAGGIPIIVCTDDVALSASQPVGIETGAWSLVSGLGTFDNVNLYNTTIRGLKDGANVLRWTISKGSCPPSTSDLTLTNNTVSANAGADFNVCAPTANLSGTPDPLLVGMSSLWTVESGGATIASPSNDPTVAAASLVQGANTFKWRVWNASCSDEDFIKVTYARVLVDHGTDPVSICSSTYTMNATLQPGETGTWNKISGTATLGTINDPLMVLTGVQGYVRIRWTVTNGICSANNIVDLTNNSPVTANAGSDQEVCATTATLAAGNATGTWTTPTVTGATITTPASPTSGITGLVAGANGFTWTTPNAAALCPDSQDDVVITNNTVVANQGTAVVAICSSTYTMNATLEAGTTGVWSLASGSATLGNVNDPAMVVTNIVGTVVLNWKVQKGACSDTKTVTITNNSAAVANAGVDQEVCTTTATLSAGNPTGAWTTASGATVTTPANPVSGVTALVSGANVFTWTVTGGGSCPNSTDNVTIVNNRIAAVNAGADQLTNCGATATLAGVSQVGTTGLWTAQSGTASFTSANSANSGVTGLGLGNNTLRWTLTKGICSNFDDVVVANNTQAVNAGSDNSVCTTTTSLTGSAIPATGTGLWSVQGGGSAITAPANVPTVAITGLSIGANTFRWTITYNTCTYYDEVVVNRTSVVADPGTTPVTICASTYTMNANLEVGTTGTWSIATGSATLGNVNDPAMILTNIVGTVTLNWTVLKGTCTDTKPVTINNNSALVILRELGLLQVVLLLQLLLVPLQVLLL